MRWASFYALLTLLLLMEGHGLARSETTIVGTWKLVSWYLTDPEGDKSYPFGPSPAGQLIYTANGQMSAQLMRPGATLPNDLTLNGPEAAEAVFSNLYFGYYGTYSMEGNTVSHHVEGSLVTTWIGTDLVREFRFIDPDTVEITATMQGDAASAAAGIDGKTVLIWERIR